MMTMVSVGSGKLEMDCVCEPGNLCGDIEFLWGPAGGDSVLCEPAVGVAVLGKTTFLCAAWVRMAEWCCLPPGVWGVELGGRGGAMIGLG